MAEKLYTVEQVNGNTDAKSYRKSEQGEMVAEQPARSGFLCEPKDVFAARMEVLRSRREGGDETSSDWTREREATAEDMAKYEKREFPEAGAPRSQEKYEALIAEAQGKTQQD